MPPDTQGYVDVDGVKIGYEVFGDDHRDVPTVLLMPTWTIVHSRFWKMQVPYLARHCRVVTYDGPGNGRSDRPLDPVAYTSEAAAAQALAVMEASDTAEAVVVGLSKASVWMLELAGRVPERVRGAVFIAPSIGLTPAAPERVRLAQTFLQDHEDLEGWERYYNASYWRNHWHEFAEFFFSHCFSEPHSTKQREDTVGWALETTPEVLVAEALSGGYELDELEAMARAMSCPVLAIHGTDDHISPPSRSERLAELTGGELVLLEGAGHIPLARDPVKVNLLIRDFVDRVTGFEPKPSSWTRGKSRTKRALWISSPIGLGHVRRDLATAQALRERHPDLEIDWLAQHPVTTVLDEAGESVHPASRHLASESAHIESESGEHDLHCFQAWRRMDEILLADFMVFHDVVTSGHYDLVVGDEAWDVDYYLHENPELKRFAYAWSTDFVGWLPMPDGGDHERYLTADYNAEMIAHIARYPRVRDAALFVGSPEDIVDERFGPDLPMIREWTEQHYTFPGYITGFDPHSLGDRDELRHRLGYRPDEQVCIVTVGGSGVGTDLLRRTIDAFPLAKRQVPGLRMIVVAGPRIDPDSLPQHEGLDVGGYVPELYRHLVACDLAVVQGGLTTCMELTASGRPFIYIPLRNHFEQNHHVHHRLQRHRAGRRLDYEEATPDGLAVAITQEIGRNVDYRPVETDGAARAAAILAELL
ncbi:MAG: alpha/beta fold hydrolase [Nitriliruptorales bacterium]|nr:alpha/beta fold hydrolase [Nitriliruptorales bacterium]